MKDTAPINLAIPVAKIAIKKSGTPADLTQHAVYGHVIYTEPIYMYFPRCFPTEVGLPDTVLTGKLNVPLVGP